jgi:hypothetical protein
MAGVMALYPIALLFSYRILSQLILIDFIGNPE